MHFKTESQILYLGLVYLTILNYLTTFDLASTVLWLSKNLMMALTNVIKPTMHLEIKWHIALYFF